MNILDEIVRWKAVENYERRRSRPMKVLESTAMFGQKCLSLHQKMVTGNTPGLIAEFKRRSPSKGLINGTADPVAVTKGYADAGVLAVSVLTDEKYFGGSLSDLEAVRKQLAIPVLRKDFIIDEYQVLEAKASGADIILLIAAALGRYELTHLASLAVSLGMEVLFEIHEEEELEKLNPDITFVGVNNRSLRTFEVNIQNSLDLANKIPADFLKISESGLSSAKEIKSLFSSGYKGFLLGEAFMHTTDPALACKKMINELTS
ncbi:MAG: indole-3-glycerol phosphate synthase TrpC [Bacteroidales bacterium]